jgi:hypothetical protein
MGAPILIGLGILISSEKHGESDALAVIDPLSCCQLVRMGHEKRSLWPQNFEEIGNKSRIEW